MDSDAGKDIREPALRIDAFLPRDNQDENLSPRLSLYTVLFKRDLIAGFDRNGDSHGCPAERDVCG